jgi:hypothetical protein
VSTQAQGVDVVPTVLEAMGVPLPPDLAGLPLQRALEAGLPARTALSEISHRGFVAHGIRSERDKYIRRFDPDRDELYFDLVRDPAEQSNILEDHPDRVGVLQSRAEELMSPDPFRYVVEVAGNGPWALLLEANGWIDDVETAGFGPEGGVAPGGNGRWLELKVGSRPDGPRRVSFTVRPRGTPVTLSGTRGGQPLEPAHVAVAASAWHPVSLPSRLPDVESEAEKEGGLDLFAPPPEGPGVRVWRILPEGQTLMELDEATRERLEALGYLGS